jgi:cytidine deaminase
MNRELRSLAEAAARKAYAPYSGLHVGAALRSRAGRIHVGCNVENGALTVGGCAERAAIAAAVVAEGTAFRLAEIVVAAFDADGQALPVSPCGACRQALMEFGAEAEVSFLGSDGRWFSASVAALFPHPFALPR